VLVASALWIAGGIVSPYAVCFLLVLTALERRIGGLRAAGVFLLGHGPATLATGVPVGLAALAGQLPASSLHRFDYGIGFGVAASIGAPAGVLTPWLRRPVLVLFGGMPVQDLVDFADPMTSWAPDLPGLPELRAAASCFASRGMPSRVLLRLADVRRPDVAGVEERVAVVPRVGTASRSVGAMSTRPVRRSSVVPLP
jgi:hypothetical protein